MPVVDRAIRSYYNALAAYRARGVEHESALRTAFQNLLDDTARQHDWKLVPESSAHAGQRRIRPDGTLYDRNNFPRGYWEAKDTHDHLEAEIARKIDKGYPITNTIFEDTRRAILYQDRREVLRVDLLESGELTDLLRQFYAYEEPDIAGFEQAVAEFGARVPELARGLAARIAEAHRDHRFAAAFENFHELCRASLNPNLGAQAVDEMLVQHLLTERLFRTIFDDPDFTRRNIIASEVERVIDALVRTRFNRAEYLKGLDRFYLAIEDAARTIPTFADKQDFLNTVYQRFFQGYSVRVADTHGIVYTPQAIVNFMVSAVAEALETEFGKSLADPEVLILDPCTGTGNFLVHLLDRLPQRDLPTVYKSRLFANEVMLLPYYIAALNIEHAYYDKMQSYEAFPGLCFVDTLEIPEKGQMTLFTQENAERVYRQKQAPITVILGNPPYNVGQKDENDNNKNRKYDTVDRRIAETYVNASTATLRMQLYDPYVRFFRWASDRLGDRDGMVCFVSNNSFVNQIAFDGMRKHLLQDFTRVYHLNLQGNVRQNPKLSGSAYNVFGIQVGVGITLAMRKAGQQRGLYYHAVPLDWRGEKKLDWLDRQRGLSAIKWEQLTPDDRHTWLVPEHADEFAAFLPMATKKGTLSEPSPGLFQTYSTGVKTNRDEWVYAYSEDALREKAELFTEAYNGEVDRWKRRRDVGARIDNFVKYDDRQVKWSETLKRHLGAGHYAEFERGKVRNALYRPFNRRLLFYDAVCNDRPGLFAAIFPTSERESENTVIVVKVGTEWPMFALATNKITDYLPQGGNQCFPLYTYDPDGANRRDNITAFALDRFRTHYRNPAISRLQIFHYIYALLHHPGYRARFAENLKRELPRIPLAPDFAAFACAGAELARLHLEYESLEPYPLRYAETPGVPLSYAVEDKMRLTRDRTSLAVNPSLTLAGIPHQAFDYRLGNRSALEWVIDQYQVAEDPRSGIRSDPNRPEDPEYIVRLVGQVTRVSLETVRIVAALPSWEPAA